MQTKKDDPVCAIFDSDGNVECSGLTKREFFAAAALQGILANPDGCLWKLAAEEAVKKADELIKELNQTDTNGVN